MSTYIVTLTYLVEVQAEDQWQAREIVTDNLINGQYNESFADGAEITDAEREDDEEDDES